MNNKETIQELKELNSRLASLSPPPAYTVPEGYFENFAAQVLNRIQALNTDDAVEELNLLSPVINSISKELPYSVPNGYFDGFENKLMSAIHQPGDYQTAGEELFSLSPLLTSIGKQNPYAVPQGYFENIENNINLKSNTQTAKTVSMVNRKWFRYAAAAVIIGFVTLTGIQFLNNNSRGVKHSSEVIDLKNVSTADINAFIQITDESASDQNSATASAKTDIKDLMKDVSDKDIQDFFNKTSAGSEEADADIILN
ncbi:MAG: hypothetical protein JWM28_1841 [Chitinophagaceae bacterium]|nr:hypothetical protein [Chitinophagaceae bacterium]